MKKKNVMLSLFLSLALLVTGLGINTICTYASDGNIVIPYSIGSVSVYLEKQSSNTLSYKVKGATNESMSTSVTAAIVLQKYEFSKWVDKQTITKTGKNIKLFDFIGTINVKSYGEGRYRIQVTVSDVYNGTKYTVDPVCSGTVIN